MNQILLFPEDYTSEDTALLRGRRFEHLSSILKAGRGDTLRAGIINGRRGEAKVTELGSDFARLEVTLTEPPPAEIPLTLVLALPRPKSLKKVIHYATAMGVKKFFLIRSWRVEKSYFESPLLEDEALKEEMVLALEQARDTVIPQIEIRKLFKPFIEDELPAIAEGTLKLTAHPTGIAECPRNISEPATLVIGPEGGFIDYEIKLLERAGFTTVTIGERILRVENAVASLIGRLY